MTTPSSASTNSSGSRLILHFDVNKTILIADAGSGVTMPQMINAILSECVYGRVDASNEWHPVGAPTTTPPPSPNAAGERMLTYGRWLETIKYRDQPGIEHLAMNRANKAQRRAFKTTFTHAGQLGAPLASYAAELDAALRLPAAVAATVAKHENKTTIYTTSTSIEHHDEPLHTWSLGYYHVLPSFFELLLHLQRLKRDVAIVFRTFGIDGVDIAKEMNLFASGKHPCYPDARMDGSPEAKGYDLRVSLAEQTACFYREQKDGAATVSIVSNTLHTVPTGDDLNYYTSTAFSTSRHIVGPSALPPSVVMTHGITNVLPLIRKMVHADATSRVALLRDHHPYWAAHAEGSHAGKLMILDTHPPAAATAIATSTTSTTTEPVIHQIFFDDNIEHDESHIVDLRYADGTEVPFEYGRGRHLWRSEPFDAIHNKQYFIESLAAAEKLFAS